MFRSPIFLKIWGLAISALGIWYIVTWGQAPDFYKDGFKLAVGIFCLLVGVIVTALNLKMRKNRKDN